jgi:predicted transcriptional regulator
MERELAKQLEIRIRLLDIIKSKPGIHFREILRESKIAMGELEYHLHVLERMELVSKKPNTHYTRYFPAYELGPKDRKIMSLLRQPMLREILLYLIQNEKATHKDIKVNFKLVKSTVTFYMKKLEKSGIVEKEKKGRNVIYRVKDPESILRLIILYKKGFGDEIVKRVEGLWGNL